MHLWRLWVGRRQQQLNTGLMWDANKLQMSTRSCAVFAPFILNGESNKSVRSKFESVQSTMEKIVHSKIATFLELSPQPCHRFSFGMRYQLYGCFKTLQWKLCISCCWPAWTLQNYSLHILLARHSRSFTFSREIMDYNRNSVLHWLSFSPTKLQT